MRKGFIFLAAAAIIGAATIGLKARAFAADDTTLKVGTVAPTFTLPSQTESPVSLKDYKGKYVVLYFYP